MLLAQLGVITGLSGMALNDPALNLEVSVLLALLVAVSSATQDITVDAFRIESGDERMQAAMAATYMVGYRLAMITATAGVLAIAALVDPDEGHYEHRPWMVAYLCMALLMLPGLLTTLLSREPPPPENTELEQQRAAVRRWSAERAHLPAPLTRIAGWIFVALICPFADFVRRYRWQALLILALIGSYRIADIVMGVIANVFYVDIGFSKAEIAAVTKVFGVAMTLIGALARRGTGQPLWRHENPLCRSPAGRPDQPAVCLAGPERPPGAAADAGGFFGQLQRRHRHRRLRRLPLLPDQYPVFRHPVRPVQLHHVAAAEIPRWIFRCRGGRYRLSAVLWPLPLCWAFRCCC